MYFNKMFREMGSGHTFKITLINVKIVAMSCVQQMFCTCLFACCIFGRFIKRANFPNSFGTFPYYLKYLHWPLARVTSVVSIHSLSDWLSNITSGAKKGLLAVEATIIITWCKTTVQPMQWLCSISKPFIGLHSQFPIWEKAEKSTLLPHHLSHF